MLDLYVLRGHQPVPAVDLDDWAQSRRDGAWRVAADYVGEVWISTIFLGVDHNFLGAGPPLLFETMVWGGPLDGHQQRWSTWENAERGHALTIARVSAAGVGLLPKEDEP